MSCTWRRPFLKEAKFIGESFELVFPKCVLIQSLFKHLDTSISIYIVLEKSFEFFHFQLDGVLMCAAKMKIFAGLFE